MSTRTPAPRTVTLYSVKRLTNSVNGNPRYRLHTSNGDLLTKSDAACSYDIENLTRHMREPFDVQIQTTRAGRVWSIERVTTAPVTYSRADIVNGTGFAPGQRFVAI